ncbi:hypothetical protein V5799_014039 [Amblyomma americanum]|uniref:Nucleoside phosphorylase domain-containing protein n=1 Tax=Amblyomma americanum TaxID=6943 RepID=A0AAQ4E467_AMBAM
MGGTSTRMHRFAQFIKAGLDIKLPTGADLYDICSRSSQCYSMYKIGPVLSVSFILGERVSRPCRLDADLAREVMDVGGRFLPAVRLVQGKTLSTDDFYEGQGRLDGSVCEYTEEAKRKFMEKIRAMGVCNIEMEACQFAAMCHHVGIKGAVVCTTIVDRMKGDQVTAAATDMTKWQDQIQELALQFIRNRLGLQPTAKK